MPTKEKRFTIVLNHDLEKKLNDTKKNLFYNKSHSEMIRQLLTIGLSHIEKDK